MSSGKLPPLSARRSVAANMSRSHDEVEDVDDTATAKKVEPIALVSRADPLENTSAPP